MNNPHFSTDDGSAPPAPLCKFATFCMVKKWPTMCSSRCLSHCSRCSSLTVATSRTEPLSLRAWRGSSVLWGGNSADMQRGPHLFA